MSKMTTTKTALQAVATELVTQCTGRYATILADPPWRFSNRTGKMAPEHKRLARYTTLTNDQIAELPINELALPQSHLYLWVPNALISEGLEVMKHWGFTYKTNIVWYKVRKDGGPDRRGVGFYFRNVTELVLFGVRGRMRTGPAGRRQPNLVKSQKRGHSRKPEELYQLIEACSPGPFLELFARFKHPGWDQWGDELELNGSHLTHHPVYDGPRPKPHISNVGAVKGKSRSLLFNVAE